MEVEKQDNPYNINGGGFPSSRLDSNRQDQEMYLDQQNQNQDYEETQPNHDGFFVDTNSATACSVRVALRVRPLVGRELYESPNICITCYPENNQLVIGKDRQFTFDKIFDIGTHQQDVFEICVKNLVLGCFQGYNATVLAYGQTGSGKTHTMGSGYTIGIKEHELGIIPRVIRLIFDEVDRRKHKAEFIIKCTFLEIYNEELHDLLDHGTLTGNTGPGIIDRFIQKKEISIREEKNGSISVFGLREEKVNSYEELAACLDKGSNFRSTASTLMNNCSSRSHAIFTISIEQHVIEDLYKPEGTAPQTAATNPDEFMVAKFHFVDLAGSERAKRTGATGNTLKEGISINKGLLSLGNVIAALTEEGKKNHVPYRDSKLTRILQDSLGGNSRTSMIACVSPAEINFEETLNTLKYASRARNIKNKPIVNRDPNSAQIAQLRQQVYELSRELVGCRKLLISNNIEFEQLASIPTDIGPGQEGIAPQGHSKEYMIGGQEIQKYEQQIKDLKAEKQQKERKIAQLQSQSESLSDQMAQNQIEFFSVQKERDLSRFNLESIINILKKKNLYEEVIQEVEGFKQPMDIDEGEKQSLDQLFGSQTILEEYQVKVEEQKKELGDMSQKLKALQKDYEMLIEQSQQDTTNLENKEKEIERLKRSVNKLQKENVSIRNEQRKGPTTKVSSYQTNPVQNTNNAPLASNRRVSTLYSERKVGQQQVSPYAQLKKKPLQPLQDASNEQWISRELDYNIKHFNEMFIENLSQSLSAMLVKKPNQNEKTPQQNDQAEGINMGTGIQEFNPMMEQDDMQMKQIEQNEQEDNEDDSDEQPDEVEIEQLIPQGEKEQQEVIESHEEIKQEDQQIRLNLQQQEDLIVNLEDNLKDKEVLLDVIKQQHKALSGNLLEAMKMEYHKKINQFQNEMQQLEQERVESLKKADTAQQKSKLEEAYKKKLKDLEEKLKEAKQKERDQQNMQKQSTQHKQRIKALETEIVSMKSQKVTLLKKMKEESDKHRKWKFDRVKEITQMKQSNLKKDREIQVLKRENKKKEMLAKRKQEELSAIMKKSKADKQKQINGQKDRMQKKNIDVSYLQEWIIQNTEKMLKYKDLQQALDQEQYSKAEVDAQISEEQNQYAQLSVRREKLEFRKGQLESQEEGEEEIYQIDEEINQIAFEMTAIQENIETYEEKNDFIEGKISKINQEILHFSPDDVEQLRFEQVQSIEGARACLGAFFGILLDVNVYKKQLENQNLQHEATLESLNQQLEELKNIQQANEINFQKQIEAINKEYQQKEELLMKLIMESDGTDLDVLMQNLNLASGKQKSQALVEQIQSKQQPTLTRKNTAQSAKMEIQKTNQQSYNQSKTALSKRVAELEREKKEDSKKYETIKHKLEQSNQEKDLIKRQFEQIKSKVKLQEVAEVKQSKVQVEETQTQYNTQQKSPRGLSTQQANNQKLQTLEDKRKERKLKKMGSQHIQQKPALINEPRVIADEPMEDDEEENPFNDKNKKGDNKIGEVDGNVFTRLSNTGKPLPPGTVTSLNTSTIAPQVQQPVVKVNVNEQPGQSYEDDSKWRCIFNKDYAHNGQICALASVGNQLYSTSNKSLRIWDLEKMQVVSDISAHNGFIKCMSIWEDKKLLLTASDKTILLWDMISLTQVGQLKGHKDEIRAMAVTNDGQKLFSAGKGTNGAGILIWDLRKGPQPVDEKEKGQDVFSLAMTDNQLYFGCRNHYVYPMNIHTFETLAPHEPPHFDVVTSLALLENSFLVSGSRDKNLRCWDYSNSNKHTDVMGAHSDWINALETDSDRKEMYSGSKDGVVKVWKMRNKQLKCVAGLATTSNGSINTLCKIDKQFGKMFASGSSDKQLRIWKFKNQGNNTSPDQDQDQFDDPLEQDNNMDYQDDADAYQQVKMPPFEESKQEQVKIVRSNTSQGYTPVMSQPSKLEQKRREKRLQGRTYKENENNLQ